MKIMRIGFRRRRGSASLWTFFIAAVLISFSVLIYTGMIVRSKYLLATTEIERAANVALDASLINPMVRDIQLAVPLPVVENSFDSNLRDAGFSFLGDSTWVRYKDERIIYSIHDYTLSQDGDRYVLTGTLQIPMTWGPLAPINPPIRTTVQILFLDFS
jgi:hypothetical protein